MQSDKRPWNCDATTSGSANKRSIVPNGVQVKGLEVPPVSVHPRDKAINRLVARFGEAFALFLAEVDQPPREVLVLLEGLELMGNLDAQVIGCVLRGNRDRCDIEHLHIIILVKLLRHTG